MEAGLALVLIVGLQAAGIPAEEQHLYFEECSQLQLEGPMTITQCGINPKSTLTLMQAWTLFVMEQPSVDPDVVEKAEALGLDIGSKVHTLEGELLTPFNPIKSESALMAGP